MWKKVTLGAFALLLGLLANTHMVCRVSIGGEAVEGCYSPWAHDRGALPVWFPRAFRRFPGEAGECPREE